MRRSFYLIFQLFLRNSVTSSIVGIEGDDPFLVTAIAEAEDDLR